MIIIIIIMIIIIVIISEDLFAESNGIQEN